MDRRHLQEGIAAACHDRNYRSALIVGAGSGLSASLARVFAKSGMSVALAARSADKLAELAQETGAKTYHLRRQPPRPGR